MLNPLYLLIPPLLILVSIPFATFAIFTSTLAFSTLLLRVLAVYVELGFTIAHNYIFLTPTSKPHPSPPRRKPTLNPTSTTQAAPQRRKRRGSSAGSTVSDQGTHTSTSSKPNKETFIGLGLSKSPSMERDFEGVGGWRFPSSTDPAFEDSLWTSMNSRLELPAASALPAKRHRRSLTSGSLTAEGRRGRWGSGTGLASGSPMDQMPMSPMQMRAKTPPAGRASPEGGYFGAKASTKSNSALDAFGRERGVGGGHRKCSSSSTGSSGKGIQLATK